METFRVSIIFEKKPLTGYDYDEWYSCTCAVCSARRNHRFSTGTCRIHWHCMNVQVDSTSIHSVQYWISVLFCKRLGTGYRYEMHCSNQYRLCTHLPHAVVKLFAGTHAGTLAIVAKQHRGRPCKEQSARKISRLKSILG